MQVRGATYSNTDSINEAKFKNTKNPETIFIISISIVAHLMVYWYMSYNNNPYYFLLQPMSVKGQSILYPTYVHDISDALTCTYNKTYRNHNIIPNKAFTIQ